MTDLPLKDRIALVVGASRGIGYESALALAKAGAEALMKCWADEIESMPIRVAVLDPGRMRTAMRAQAYPGEDPEQNVHPSAIGPLIVELARPDLEPPLTVSFKDWNAGPQADALV